VAEHSMPPGYGGSDALDRRLVALLAHGGTRETIGSSREGRPIHAYRWGEVGATSILVISLLHPMEWIGLETHLALLEALLLQADPAADPTTDSAADPRADLAADPAMRRPPAILSIPVANPDGFARVEASLRDGGPRWIRGNAAGVDLNRNFPVGHRVRPALLAWWPLYRPGPSALSEPETAAIAAWIEGNTAERPVRLSLSLHSFGRQVFAPPARMWRSLPGTASMVAAARAATAGSGYRARQLARWSPFFRAHGAEIDFLHEATQAPAYLVEISGGGFGRWGARRLMQPFCLFNPPRPEREIARILPVLRGLVEIRGARSHSKCAASCAAIRIARPRIWGCAWRAASASSRMEVCPMPIKDLITEAMSLPVEDRAILADTILKSLNSPDSEMDRKWVAVAKRRLAELRSGQVEALPGDEVFARIRKRFAA